MRLSPYFYTKIVRPRFATKKYIEDVIKEEFSFKGKTVLDFGCGTGSNCLIFEAGNYLGVDVDKDRIKFARRLFPGYEFETLNSNQINSKNKMFDYICIFAVIHHISDREFLRYTYEFLRVLKPGGRIIVIEPYLLPGLKFSNKFMNFFDEGNYIRSKEEYLKLFGDGFIPKLHKKFKKFGIYNELFFSLVLKSSSEL